MSVTEIMPGIWLASYKWHATIGNSFADAIKACLLEAGLTVAP